MKNAAKCKLAFKFQRLRVIEKCGEHFMAIKVNIIINNFKLDFIGNYNHIDVLSSISLSLMQIFLPFHSPRAHHVTCN